MNSLSDNLLAIIREAFPRLRAPSASSKVYNDECVFSFDSPFSDRGLYINLISFEAVGADFLHSDAVRTNARVYLHAKYEQVPKENAIASEDKAEEQAPTKLAIGVDGGFDVGPKYKVTKAFQLFVFTDPPTPDNESSCKGEFIPLPFINQQMARDLPARVVHLEGEAALGHVGLLIPEFVRNICLEVLNHDGMTSRMQLDTWEADLDIVESKYARNLVQLDNGKKISNDPTTWRCEMSGDTSNLWLNLSTGYIGGGRKFWDGSGGSGAALVHYEETGKMFPLCVKLGTITQHGADVWSYADDEDALVKDPLLAEHLSHWGIDIMKLEKTEKTLGETELEKNMKYDWSKILEQGENLVALAGPGRKGLVNVGSSCYMNSVLQAFFAIPEVQEKYFSSPWAQEQIYRYTRADPPSLDLSVQLVKLGNGLLSDRYVEPVRAEDEKTGDEMPQLKFQVAPRMLKYIVGKGHREFSSCRQQDASEYFQHLLQLIEREEFKQQHASTSNSLFSFDMEERYECDITKQVKYVTGQQTRQNVLEVRIPVELVSDTHPSTSEEKSEEVLKRQKLNEDKKENEKANVATKESPLISFDSCLENYFQACQVDIRNPSLGSELSTATKAVTFFTFPKYLMVKLGRYYVDSNWTMKKIDNPVSVPESLDLTSYLRPAATQRTADGLQEGEVAMPAAAPSSGTQQPAAQEPSEEIVAQLVSMGFSENGSKRAALATQNSNADIAMAWVFEHMEDPDFNDPPLNAPAATAATGGDCFNETDVATLSSFGYTTEQAQGALKATDHNMERAADWLFSHPDDLDLAVAQVLGGGAQSSAAGGAGGGDIEVDPLSQRGKYRLLAIISHMGRNTECGHYVAHVKKDGMWVLFNDEKVAESKSPPFQHGFMYLFARDDE